ncbi:MAG: LLM class flavin-dependent oxidoreductase [Chloroflexi bacterium]|nr:LLM class flavin-dependent oxidoreductase [Chloroflexota bacterium]
MDIGVGLDASLGLSLDQQGELSGEAARLGYTSIWTPEGTGQDSFQLCAHRWAATRDVTDGGLVTGIAVCPVMYRTPVAFAMSAGTVSELTAGRFILGIGSGAVYRPKGRRALGLPRLSALSMMRDYLVTTRALLAGEEVNYEGPVVTLNEAKLGIDPPPRTPVYLGALGPEMLRLSGELANGAALNWCTPEQIAWSRERIAEGAARTGRDPSEVSVAEYIRICVDDDEDVARRAFARSVMGYALGDRVPTERERALGYRAHFERMGFTEALAELDDMRGRGASADEVADAFPSELMRRVGYYGPAAGAAKAFRGLAEGLDTAIVRVVAAGPGVESVQAVMDACRPALVQ